MNIRPATRADLPGILEIYNEAVLNTTASYDYEPRTLEHRIAWYEEHLKNNFPIFVAQSLAAQMMALSGLEQCRAAKFDPRGSSVDQLVSSNFPPRVDILDVGTTASILTYGTNTTTIRTISNDPLIKMIRVDCTWYYPRRGRFTNSVFTYRAPNQ